MTYEEIVALVAPLGLRPATSADSFDTPAVGIGSGVRQEHIDWLQSEIARGRVQWVRLGDVPPSYYQFVFTRKPMAKSSHAKPLPLP